MGFVWFIGIIVFAILEAATFQFVSIWFACSFKAAYEKNAQAERAHQCGSVNWANGFAHRGGQQRFVHWKANSERRSLVCEK